MNHPNREEWMSFLYEETDPGERSKLTAHLHGCGSCQQHVARWRGAMGAMNQWKIDDRPRASRRPVFFRWAAAACLLLAIGFGIGSVASRANASAMRKDLQNQRAMIDELTRAVAQNRARDQQALVATLRELETRRAAEMQTLRGDLETVAALTEESLNRAQNQLVRLASYTGAR
jgi:hypothetical protein